MREIVIDPERIEMSADWLSQSRLVVEYLEDCPAVFTAMSYLADAIDPTRPARVPLGAATDGTFIWPLALAYYVREHAVVPPEELLAHIREQNYRAPSVSAQQIDQALEFARNEARG